MTKPDRLDTAVLAALAAVMLITRTHSLSQMVHLPDTSWASYFVMGAYVRTRAGFPALFLLGLAIDLVMIRLLGTPDFCFTVAYWMLVPAYGVMWLAGRWARRHLAVAATSLPALAVLVALASLGAELLSSGGFYFFGGRFPDPTLAGFLPRLARYFPYTLEATLLWTGVAVAAHALVLTANPALRQTPRG
jgi:cell shape-determining protein MreD